MTLALATVVVFAVVEVLPGDPALVMLGTDARPDTLAALRAQYGFDQPLIVRYFTWIGGLLTFDLGNSHAYGTSVAKLIGDRLQVTLPLAALALCWAMLVAIPLGVFAAWKHGRAGDWGVMGFTQIGISVPNFWFGIVLVLLFAVTWQCLPGRRLSRLAPGAAEIGARADPAGAVAVAGRDRDPGPGHPLGHARHPARGLCPHRPRQGRARADRAVPPCLAQCAHSR